MVYRKMKKINGYVIQYLDSPIWEEVVTGSRGTEIKIFRHGIIDDFEEEDE
jgi:hypothetical protein